MIKKIKNKLQQIKPNYTAALLGALYTFGFAPSSLWLVGLLALSGLFCLFKQSKSVKQAFIIGLIFGTVHYVTSLHWLVSSFYVTIGSLWLAVPIGGFCVLLLSLYLSLYIAALGAIIKSLTNKFNAYLPALFTVTWLLFEYIRSSLTPTFAWNLAGYQLAYFDELLQMAYIGGVYILSALFVFLAVSVVSSKKWRIAGLVVFIVCYLFGYERLANNKPVDVTTANDSKLHVRLVSGDIKQTEKWQADKKKLAIEKYITASNTGVGVPDVVVWPETSITYLLNKHSGLRKYLADNIIANKFIVGAPYKDENGFYYNSLYMLDGNGVAENRYDKRFLVPFGEYFPFREYFPAFFEKFLQGQGEYTSGKKQQSIFSVDGITFSPLICGEVVLPNLKKYNHNDAMYILNTTNDAWFSGTIGTSQHFSFVKVQAVSLNKPFIRVSNFGINAFVDKMGRLIVKRDIEAVRTLDLYL